MQSIPNEQVDLKALISQDNAELLRDNLKLPENQHKLNARDSEGKTLLYHAVGSSKPQCVEALLALGAKTFLADFKFITPIQVAKNNAISALFSKFFSTGDTSTLPADTCLKLLYQHLSTFRPSDLDDSLAFAFEHYDPKDDGNNTGNMLVSAYCVSLWTGQDLLAKPQGNTYSLHQNQVKYFGHLHNVSGIIKEKIITNQNEVDLEGWFQQQFLLTRLRILFQLMVKLSCSSAHSGKNSPTAARLELVKKEFCVTMETFQILLASAQLTNVGSASNDLQRELALNVRRRIKDLPSGGELVLAVGWADQKSGHALYVAFQKTDTSIVKRIDNLGEGIIWQNEWLHAAKNSVTEEYYSYIVSETAHEEFNNNPTELDYILNCNTWAVTSTHQNDVQPTLYNLSLLRVPQPTKINLLKTPFPFFAIQTVGNCALASYQPGVKNRTGDHYPWLIREESTLSDPKFTKSATLVYPEITQGYCKPRKIPAFKLESLRNYFKREYATLPSVAKSDRFNIDNFIVNLREANPEGLSEEEVNLQPQSIIPASLPHDPIKLNTLLVGPTKPQSIVITGAASFGKTTLCLHILNSWSKSSPRRKLKLICHIPLRNLNAERYPEREQPYQLSEIIQQECFRDGMGNGMLDHQLEQLIANHTVLWLLDGYDELVLPLQLQKVWDDLLKLASNRIVTTRPYRMPEFPVDKTFSMAPYQLLHIYGFINKYFADNATATALKHYIKAAPNLLAHIRTPGNLAMLCKLWQDDREKLANNPNIAVTRLFYEFLQLNVRLTLAKSGLSALYLDNATQLFSLSATTLKSYQRLAYFMKLNNQREVSQESLRCYVGKSNSLDTVADMLKYGFLVATGSSQSPFYVFSHASYLDFFCALFLYNKLCSKNSQDILSYISKNKYENNFTLVLRFLSGFIHQPFPGLVLISETSRRHLITHFWHAIDQAPRELSNYHHIRLWVALLQETPEGTIARDFKDKLDIIAHYYSSSQVGQQFYWHRGSSSVQLTASLNDLLDTLIESPAVLECLCKQHQFFDNLIKGCESGGKLNMAVSTISLSRFIGTSQLNHSAFTQRMLASLKNSGTVQLSAQSALTQLAAEDKLTLTDINTLLSMRPVNAWECNFFMGLISTSATLIASNTDCVNVALNYIASSAFNSHHNHRYHDTLSESGERGLHAYYHVLDKVQRENLMAISATLSNTLPVLLNKHSKISADFQAETKNSQPDDKRWLAKIFAKLIKLGQLELVLRAFRQLLGSLGTESTQASALLAVDALTYLSPFLQHINSLNNDGVQIAELFKAFLTKINTATIDSSLTQWDKQDLACRISSAKIVYLTNYFTVKKRRQDFNIEELLTELDVALRQVACYNNRSLQILALKAASKIYAKNTLGVSKESMQTLLNDYHRLNKKAAESGQINYIDTSLDEALQRAFDTCGLVFTTISFRAPSTINLPALPSTYNTNTPHQWAFIQESFSAFVNDPTIENGRNLFKDILKFSQVPCITLTADSLCLRGHPTTLVWPHQGDKALMIKNFLSACETGNWVGQYQLQNTNATAAPLNDHIDDRLARMTHEILNPSPVRLEKMPPQWQFFTTAPAPVSETAREESINETVTKPPHNH